MKEEKRTTPEPVSLVDCKEINDDIARYIYSKHGNVFDLPGKKEKIKDHFISILSFMMAVEVVTLSIESYKKDRKDFRGTDENIIDYIARGLGVALGMTSGRTEEIMSVVFGVEENNENKKRRNGSFH